MEAGQAEAAVRVAEEAGALGAGLAEAAVRVAEEAGALGAVREVDPLVELVSRQNQLDSELAGYRDRSATLPLRTPFQHKTRCRHSGGFRRARDPSPKQATV